MSAVLGSHRAEHEKKRKKIPQPGGNREGEFVKEVLYTAGLIVVRKQPGAATSLGRLCVFFFLFNLYSFIFCNDNEMSHISKGAGTGEEEVAEGASQDTVL